MAFHMEESWDCIIIGGGAAGFFGAITCAEAAPRGSKILIVEKTAKLLGKVKISGGGRCNVTHHCFDAKQLSKHYPRGEKSLIGPLNRWGAEDTVRWFESRGVELKTEADGRMFPVSDDSQSIIQCLINAANEAGVTIRTSTSIESAEVKPEESNYQFELVDKESNVLQCKHLLIASGGTRLAAGAKLAEQLGHELEPAVPSLFTFKISDPRLADIPGISVEHTSIQIKGTKLQAEGPLLVTHWGLSGPGVLRISAWGARQLHEMNYQCELSINWLPGHQPLQQLQQTRQQWGKRQVGTKSPFPEIAKRLWESIVLHASIPKETLWSQLTKQQIDNLTQGLTNATFTVNGQSLNKDEFVTCGGVLLKDIQLKTMQSKLVSNLYFAGEVMNVDGITGGFNFQNAWCSGYHAGRHIAQSLDTNNTTSNL